MFEIETLRETLNEDNQNERAIKWKKKICFSRSIGTNRIESNRIESI